MLLAFEEPMIGYNNEIKPIILRISEHSYTVR